MIGIIWWNSGPEPGTAPFEGRAIYGLRSIEDKAVTTELYTYPLEHERSDLPYQFVGKPLRFSFPKKYYYFSSNFEGGPQLLIALALDAETLRATTDDMKKCCGAKSLDNVYRRLRQDSRNNIMVQIHSREGSKPQGAEHEIEQFFEYAEQNQKIPVDRMCDHIMYDGKGDSNKIQENHYREQHQKNGRSIVIDGLDLFEKSYFGVRRLNRSQYQTLHCPIDSKVCIGEITYMDHLVRFFMDKKFVCRYPDLGVRIWNFIDDHRVGGVGSAGPELTAEVR